ncbi:PepSY domain-containing protein [Micromonospora carbonacea]|uniref:PepSY domain-containing protein n=1 Tax=Micromonospora carbonacea TaxID=47853 RepID=UPI003D757535
MKRNSLIMASLGGAAMLAAAGVAVGVTAADDRVARTTLTAATAAPVATTTPGDGPTGTPTGAPPATGVPSATGVPAETGAPAAKVDRQRAGEIALARAGGGRIVEIEADDENGRAVWSVEIVDGQTEHEIDVDRNDGTVVDAEREPVDADDDHDDADDRDDHDDDVDDRDDD